MNRKKRSQSSQRWLEEHSDDVYVKRAKAEGYRSRAAYKLLEIQEKDHIFEKGMTIVDLGAAPGGWSQVAARYVGEAGKVIAMDLLEMEPILHVDFLQGDFMEDETLDALHNILKDKQIDVVMSDMAPNTSGIRTVDQARSMGLVECALEFAKEQLKSGGTFLCKIFQGPDCDAFLMDLRKHFEKVKVRKPKASRERSPEVYYLAMGYKRKIG